MSSEMRSYTFGYRQWHSFYAEPSPIGRQPVGQFGQQAVAQMLCISCGHTTSTTTGSATAWKVKAYREMRDNNPGVLYGRLTPAEMRKGNVSRRRNPLIADLFRRIEMVEGWGRGMPLILENAPNVEFRQVAGLFIASFARPSFSLNDQETVEKTVYKTVDNSNKPTLTAREDALLRLLASNPRMTQKQLADQLGLTERGVRYLTDKLQQLGVLQRQGGKKAGQWVVVQAPNNGAAP